MAKRHHLTDARVQTVVDELIRHLRSIGSVNALAHRLSEAAGQRIYPNRIHGLLAEDSSRTITYTTLDALERGLAALPEPSDDAEPYRDLGERVAAVLSSIPTGTDAVAAVGKALDLPPAVVRRSIPEAAPTSAAVVEASTGNPDWSWQETAVRIVVGALRQPIDNRVGLIVPTGGGKTRLGLRVILEQLSADPSSQSVAVWVTHRRRLARQARRSLQQLLREGTHVPEDATKLFESRIKFVMLGDLKAALDALGSSTGLIVLDEAHHAAAPSYAPIFANPAPALFLTATPVRADHLPIGIDRVAFSITYRELFERNCVIEPIFDPPLDLVGLNWSTSADLAELADYLLDRTEQDFGKVLVAVSQQERAERLYEAVMDLLDDRQGHPLLPEDVMFVHGARNSLGVGDASDALDESAGKPVGILIATSALVGEGYDDPSIDAAVVTYPSTSIAHLMQVAGRALRWAPGKKRAHVVQVRDSSLQYYFDQRWLYQDISDELRPDLVDLEYGTSEELTALIESLLANHNVSQPVATRVMAQLTGLTPGMDVRMMLCGINYYGSVDTFSQAPWNALLADQDEWPRFLNIFNDVSMRRDDIKEAQLFLQSSVAPDPSPGSLWKTYMDLINAAEYARREINGSSFPGDSSRPYNAGSNTSWLRYVTLRFRPTIPVELDAFLSDAVNRDRVLTAFSADPPRWTMAVKLRLPLARCVAYLLESAQAAWLAQVRSDLHERLRDSPLEAGFNEIAAWRTGLESVPIPVILIDEVAQLLRNDNWDQQHLDLG